MIATMSASIAAGPVGRSFTRMRSGPIGQFFALPILDLVIPPTLFFLIIAAFLWIAFVPN